MQFQHKWLEKHLYYGLDSQEGNSGNKYIKYFTADDFLVLLNRTRKELVGIHRIEVYYKGKFCGMQNCKPYSRLTHYIIFEEFYSMNKDYLFAATLEVPLKVLCREYFFWNGRLKGGW